VHGLDVVEQGLERPRGRDAGRRHRLVEHADRTDPVAQILERLEDAAQPLGLGPVAAADRRQHGLREPWGHAAAAGGEAAEAEVAEVHDRRLLADAADDHGGIDESDELPQVGIMARVGPHRRVLDGTHETVAAEGRRIGGVDVAVVLDIEKRRHARRFHEPPHRRRHAAARRDPLLRQHHHRLEAMPADDAGLLHEQAIGRPGRGNDERRGRGRRSEHLEQRVVFLERQVVEVGVASIE